MSKLEEIIQPFTSMDIYKTSYNSLNEFVNNSHFFKVLISNEDKKFILSIDLTINEFFCNEKEFLKINMEKCKELYFHILVPLNEDISTESLNTVMDKLHDKLDDSTDLVIDNTKIQSIDRPYYYIINKR